MSLVKKIEKMELELEEIYRELNGMMRLIWNNNLLGNFIGEDTDTEIIYNKNNIVRLKTGSNVKTGLPKITRKKVTEKKILTKKKRRIVWNAWVVDSSSSSDSD